MDVVYLYSTTFGCDEESRNERTHQKKKERLAPKPENGKMNETRKVWRKKTMD